MSEKSESLHTLEINNISYGFPDIQVLDGLSLSSKSQIHGILGPNGAGKTILNKILGLLITPQKGEILWNGSVVSPSENSKRLQSIRRIGFMWQKSLFLSTSLFKNIEYPLVIRDLPKETRKKLVNEQLKEFRLE